MKSTYKTIISRSLYLFIALAGISAVSSCKKDTPDDDRATSKVQLVNASTDAGAARLYIDGELRAPNAVAYNTASGYNNAFVGLQDVSVQSGAGTTLITINTQMDVVTYYTYYLSGASGSYSLIKTQDDVTPAASGKAKVAFVQASPSTTLTSVNLLAGTIVVASGFAYKGVSTAYTEVTPGATIFTVTNGTSTTPLATSASVNLVGGKNYTVYTSGLVGVTGASALAVNVVANN